MAGYDAIVSLYTTSHEFDQRRAASFVEVMFGERPSPAAQRRKEKLIKRLVAGGTETYFRFFYDDPRSFDIIMQVIPLDAPLITDKGKRVTHEFALQSNVDLRHLPEVKAYLDICRAACVHTNPSFAYGGHSITWKKRKGQDPRAFLWGFNYFGPSMAKRIGREIEKLTVHRPASEDLPASILFGRGNDGTEVYVKAHLDNGAIILQLVANPFLFPDIVSQLGVSIAGKWE